MSRISVEARMPEVPKKPGPIYLLRTPRVDEKSLSLLARQFNLHGDIKSGVFRMDEKKLAYIEGSFEIVQYRASGGLRFHDTTRWQIDDGKSNITISDEEAVKIARRHVTSLKLASLGEIELHKVSRLHVATASTQREGGEERVIDAGICFRRIIEGVPVDGPGGKVIVYIDHEGEVTGTDRIWRQIRGVHQKVSELRRPEHAVEELSKKLKERAIGTVKIREVRFGYFELGWQQAQQYLQQAYVILFTFTSPDERFVMKSVHVTPAAPGRAVEALMPPDYKPAQQKPREK